MGDSSYKIQLIIEAANNAKSVINDLINQLGDVEGTTKKTGDGLSGLFSQMKEHWLGVTAAIAGVAVAANKAFDYMELGAKAEQAEASFRQVAKASGENADQIIEDMKRAANGTVDDADIMQKAVKGMVQGLSGDQLVKIMEAARIGARVAGEDVKTAYEGITDAIANKLPKGLIRYGLISQEQRKIVSEAMALGITDFNVYAIAMENAGKQAEILSNLQEDNAEKMQQWHAKVNDLKENIGKTIWDALLPILKDIESWFKKNPATIRDWAASFVEAITTIKAEVMRLSMLLDKLGGTLTSAGMLLFGPGAALGNENSKKQFDKMAAANIEYEARFNATDKELQDMANTLNARLESIRNPPAAPEARPGTKTGGTNATQDLKDAINAAKNPTQYYPDRSTLKAYQEGQELGKREAESWKAAEEAAINYGLYLVDLAEQEGKISKPEAIQKRIALNQELLNVEMAYADTIDRTKDASAWTTQQQAIIKTRQELDKLNKELKEQTGTLTEGLSEGFKQYIKDAKTAFQDGVELAKQTATAMNQAFSDFFFDAMTGQLKSLSDYIKSFLESIAREISNVMAQKTTAGIVSSIASYLGSTGSGSSSMSNSSTGANDLTVGHKGGYIMHAGGYIPRFHIGGLTSDERPIIAQTGEGILSRKGMAAFDRLNNGDGNGGNMNISFNVENKSSQPVSAKSSGTKFDGKKYVVGIVLEDLEYGGPIRTKLGL